MKKFFWNVILCCSALMVSAAESTWLTDLPKAQAQAKAEGKIVLVDFTGSDWCGWCIKLQKEVFSKPEFLQWAKANAVLVEIDFPKRKKQADDLKKANDALARKYGIEGFPTIVVLNGDGKKLGNLGYTPGGPQPFIDEVKKLSPKSAKAGKGQADLTVQARTRPDGAAPTEEPAKVEAVAKPAAPAPIPAVAKPAALKLKGISGSASRRFALINDQTFAVGEELKIKLSGGPVKVRCLEITDRSVFVSVNGSPDRTELSLADLE